MEQEIIISQSRRVQRYIEEAFDWSIVICEHLKSQNDLLNITIDKFANDKSIQVFFDTLNKDIQRIKEETQSLFK